MTSSKKLGLKQKAEEPFSSVISTAGLEININARSVTYHANALLIKGLTFDMLVELLIGDNQIISIDTLATKVWKGKVVSHETIAQRISLLRKALPEEADGYIESVRNEGYRWLPSITRRSISTSQQSIKTKHRLGVVAVVMLLVGGLYGLTKQSPEQKVVNPSEELVEYRLDINVFTRVKLARAQQYAKALTAQSNAIAISLYKDLLETESDNPDVRSGLAAALLQDIAVFGADRSNLDEINQISLSLAQQSPDNADYLWLRGFYYQVTGNLQQAIKQYQLGLSLSPSDPRIVLALAGIYTETGRLADAARLNINQLNLEQRFQIPQIANLLFLTGQYDQALKWFTAAVQLAPDDPSASANLAEFLIFNGQFDQARVILNDLHNRTEGTQDSHLIEFYLALLSNNNQAANSALMLAERLQPQSPEIIAWRAWFEQSQQRIPNVAIGDLELSENSWPSLYVAKSILALAHHDEETALAMLIRALRLGFVNYQYLLNMPPFSAMSDNSVFQEIILAMQDRQAAEYQKIKDLTIPDLAM